MSAALDTTCRVYWCLVCGPLFRFPAGDGDITLHRDIEHPFDWTYDEDDNPQ